MTVTSVTVVPSSSSSAGIDRWLQVQHWFAGFQSYGGTGSGSGFGTGMNSGPN